MALTLALAVSGRSSQCNLLALHGRHSHAEKDESRAEDPICDLLRPFDYVTNDWAIQRVDEKEPKKRAHQHHGEYEYERGTR